MIGDRAYDSDPLDARLHQQYSLELIAPHKSNRSRPKTQDGRKLRRFCRRWKIERLFAWLHNFRRLVTRWEYYEFLVSSSHAEGAGNQKLETCVYQFPASEKFTVTWVSTSTGSPFRM